MKKSNDYQGAIWLIILFVSVLASSCGTPQTKYKGHVVGQSTKCIVTNEPGFVPGDTIIIKVGYKRPSFVIESIVK